MNQPKSIQVDSPDYDPRPEDLEPDIEFRRQPHPLAIATVILGILSFVALFKTTFWIFPVVAIALGIACLISLASNPEKIGRKAALIGLALAIFFGTWAAARYFSRQQWLYGQARRNADVWLQLVQENKLRKAHQLHLQFGERVRRGESMDEYYENEEYAQDDYDTFFGSEPLSEFVKVAPRATVEFVRYDGYYTRKYMDELVLCYVAHYKEEGKPKDLEMHLIMRRRARPGAAETGWTVEEVASSKSQRRI